MPGLCQLVSFLIAVINYPDKIHLRGNIYSDSQLKNLISHGREIRTAEAGSNGLCHTHNQEAESDECLCLSLLVLSIKFRTQDLRMVPPTFSVDHPTSINLAHIISSQTCTKTTKSFKGLSID